MTAKPVVLRERARQDIDDAIDDYAGEAGIRVALGFVDRLEQALGTIGRHPANGSPRYAHELNLSGLRNCAVKRFPHLIFYVERDDLIDVWRVLHAQSDIPAWMQDPQSS
ncbi:MAG TPA: type II toxin-antitoxin system RelE/ParE family toxin [Phenylobacterium sp.]